MQQASTLLNLRITQAWRFLKETGIGISILALFLLTGGILGTIEKMLDIDQIYSLVAVVFIILTIDKFRTDTNFLNQVFGGKQQMGIYLSAEYLLFFSPLIVYKLISGQYLITLGILGITVLFSFITTLLSKTTNQGYKKSLKFIPLEYFELKFFVEKQKISFIVIISLLFLGVIHISLWILSIVLLMSFMMEMFTAQEPMEMIKWKPKFVFYKIIGYFKIALPVLIVSSLLTYLRSDLSFWVFVYGICVILAAIALAISNKYSEYYGLSDKMKSNLPMTIIAFFMLIPGFIIVTIGYTILKYNKAESQMKHLCSR
ncbi:MAG: hypothetical protein ACI86M_001897 [Saprospiraceae bacterium]|jgi:hypothetical protein